MKSKAEVLKEKLESYIVENQISIALMEIYDDNVETMVSLSILNNVLHYSNTSGLQFSAIIFRTQTSPTEQERIARCIQLCNFFSVEYSIVDLSELTSPILKTCYNSESIEKETYVKLKHCYYKLASLVTKENILLLHNALTDSDILGQEDLSPTVFKPYSIVRNLTEQDLAEIIEDIMSL